MEWLVIALLVIWAACEPEAAKGFIVLLFTTGVYMLVAAGAVVALVWVFAMALEGVGL